MHFQTHPKICDYMVGLLPVDRGIKTVLEPTPGEGNLVRALQNRKIAVEYPPGDFWTMTQQQPDSFDYYDAVVMNPPFSPMQQGYNILYRCMEMTDVIIALMPWLVLINSETRTKDIFDFGLVSVTHLPRSAFPGARVQTCILKMVRNWVKMTEFVALYPAYLKG